ncbi:MAG: hypothetical protein ACJ8LG_10760 [Massilia sp.]
MAADDVIKTFFQATVIVIGWVVVHRLSEKRDRDKARREMVAKAADALRDEITKFLSVARNYHTSDRDIDAEDSIKISLQDISARTSLLSDICKDSAELSLCKSAILATKKSVTGSHFEDEHNGPIAQGEQQVQLITADVLRAKRYYLQLKHKQFPPSG